MYRLSLIISEIYNKYLPLAEKDGISLNLDFSDTTKEISNPEQIKQYLDENLSSTLKRTDKGDVTINVDSSAIIITDTGTTLSKAACSLLSNRYIDVKSRVGFGTTVKIFFKPQEAPTTNPSSTKDKLKLEGVGLSLEVNNSEKTPILESTGKLAVKKGKRQTRLSTKLRLQRKDNTIKSAAKKADREVKRIAKKAQKTKQKAQTKTSKKPARKAQKPRKTRKLEIS